MRLLLVTTMMMLMLFAGTAFGQWGMCDNDGPHGQGMGRGHQGQGAMMGGHGMGDNSGLGHGLGRLEIMADELDLTEAQLDQLSTLQTEFKLEMVDAQGQMKKAQINLKALRRDEASESKVFAAIDEVSKLKANIQKMKFQHHTQMKALLSDEQQAKMKELRFKKGDRQGGRGFKGHGQGQGPRGM